MQTKTIPHLGLTILTGLTLSACGGSSSSNSTSINNSETPPTVISPTPPTTITPPPITAQNILTFPISTFGLTAVNTGSPSSFYTLIKKNQSLQNLALIEDIQIIHEQNPQHSFIGYKNEYLLTKEKLYFLESTPSLYVLDNSDSKLVLAYDQDGKGLTSTITFKNISLANETIHSNRVTTSLFNSYKHSMKYDLNFQHLSQSISELTDKFDDDAICHQYLTQTFNQPNISFDKKSSIGKTLDQWVSEQNVDNTVKEDIWAGYKVAYITNPSIINFIHGMGYRNDAVIEKDGQLYKGYYDSHRIFNYKEDYDNSTLFTFGICNTYNQSAALTLNQAFAKLPKL